MRASDFDYPLPPELIAQTPLAQRDRCRLLVIDRRTDRLAHRSFRDLGEYLNPGDLLVVNDTRVRPARLEGVKEPTGAHLELLLLQEEEPDIWTALVRPSQRIRPGTRLRCAQGQVRAEALERTAAGWRLRFTPPGELRKVLPLIGQVPLPPYIKTPLEDPNLYQTVFAEQEGSAAAPTAGLHFTLEMIAQLQAQGVRIAALTLHIGLDTFRPIQTEEVEDHPIHSEFCEIRPATAAAINATRAAGHRVVAVGTTTVRALESAARPGGGEGRKGPWQVRPYQEWTRLFITPGYEFRIVDALLTNFHHPRTTLMALVSAFAGPERIQRAYAEAIGQRYRFLSFGDAMLII